MPNRLRLYDCRNSRLPQVVGLCASDTVGVANYVNSAQRRLVMCREAGDEGWHGSWAEVAFNLVSRTNPYITTPRSIARIEKLAICRRSVFIQNQFYEYMDFGNGRMPQIFKDNFCHVEGYTRNNAVTFRGLTNAPQIIRIFPTSASDINSGRRVLIQGTDASDNIIYSQDGFNQVTGIFVDVDTPFADCPIQIKTLTGIQKDITSGPIQIFQVDPSTGDQILLSVMEPGEQVADYRRYFLNNLPNDCCRTGTTSQPLQVTAIAKLELIPVVVDTDYCLIQNLEAIIEECQAIRLSEIDSESAKKMAQEKHLQAVRYLQGELVHYYGKDRPAVVFAPFGSARLQNQKIGSLL